MSFYDKPKFNFYEEINKPPEERKPHTRPKVVKEYPKPPEGSKEIQGFPNYYITDQGEVWSEHSHKFLLPSEDANHYLKVSLKNEEGKFKWRTLHILVAQAFIPNPNNLPLVNHLDGNKHRCTVDNLEWDTYSGNTQHAYDTGLISKQKSVVRIDAQGNKQTYHSIKAAVDDTPNAYRSGINQVCEGKRKQHASYRWEWNNKEDNKDGN